MKCLVINLDRSPDRWAHMRGMFGRLEVSFERVPAVDGAQLPEELIARFNAWNQWVRPLIRAEIGCFLSHRACWERIAAGIDPFGVIFEDDVRISPGAQALLGASQWIPEGVDFIKLETRSRAVTVSRRSIKVSASHELVRLLTFHDGLGGYIVSRQCAQWLCAQTRERTAPVDQLVLNPQFGIFADLNVFQLTPSICIPDQMADREEGSSSAIASTIDPEGGLYESDERLLRRASSHHRNGSARRKIGRLAAALQRLLRGQKRIRVQYR